MGSHIQSLIRNVSARLSNGRTFDTGPSWPEFLEFPLAALLNDSIDLAEALVDEPLFLGASDDDFATDKHKENNLQ